MQAAAADRQATAAKTDCGSADEHAENLLTNSRRKVVLHFGVWCNIYVCDELC